MALNSKPPKDGDFIKYIESLSTPASSKLTNNSSQAPSLDLETVSPNHSPAASKTLSQGAPAVKSPGTSSKPLEANQSSSLPQLNPSQADSLPPSFTEQPQAAGTNQATDHSIDQTQAPQVYEFRWKEQLIKIFLMCMTLWVGGYFILPPHMYLRGFLAILALGVVGLLSNYMRKGKPISSGKQIAKLSVLTFSKKLLTLLWNH